MSGIVSQLPVHNGDGYSWGGDYIVTIGSRAINLGSSTRFEADMEIKRLAHLIASAEDVLDAAREIARITDFTMIGEDVKIHVDADRFNALLVAVQKAGRPVQS